MHRLPAADLADRRDHFRRQQELPLRTFIGATAVLHSWGSAMTHHPHVALDYAGGTSLRCGQLLGNRPALSTHPSPNCVVTPHQLPLT